MKYLESTVPCSSRLGYSAWVLVLGDLLVAVKQRDDASLPIAKVDFAKADLAQTRWTLAGFYDVRVFIAVDEDALHFRDLDSQSYPGYVEGAVLMDCLA